MYDCIVMGAGPAGSTVATLVAEAGYKTLLVEREKFPRYHIGESLMPDTYWTLKRLGMLEKMQSSNFVKKYSVQFVSSSGKESAPFFFNEHDPRECSQTWQVERAKFDQMLFDNAASKGAECRDETRVLEVLFDGDRATGVKLRTPDGKVDTHSARVVVDATGQSAIITSAIGGRKIAQDLKKAAIWTYYRNARREPGDNGGATKVLRTQSRKGWFWYIPLEDNITSIGVVADFDYLFKQNRGTPEEIYFQEMADCPILGEYLSEAEQCNIIRIAKEYTYSNERSSGNGWVAVGDAWGFIDPLYSSGVHFALKSGELASDAIIQGLAEDDLSASQLGNWTQKMSWGSQCVRRLVQAYYLDFFSFGQFLRHYPKHQGNVTDILIGRVFHPEADKLFDDLEPWLAKVRQEQPLSS